MRSDNDMDFLAEKLAQDIRKLVASMAHLVNKVMRPDAQLQQCDLVLALRSSIHSVSNPTSKHFGEGLPLISLLYSATTPTSQVTVVLMLGYRSLKNSTLCIEVGGGPCFCKSRGRMMAGCHSSQPLRDRTSTGSKSASHTFTVTRL
jgi:hypothetical protein